MLLCSSTRLSTGDIDHIYVGHSLSHFPQGVTNPCAFNDKGVVLVGNDISTAVALCPDSDTWARTNDFCCHSVATLVACHAMVLAQFVHLQTSRCRHCQCQQICIRHAFSVNPANASGQRVSSCPQWPLHSPRILSGDSATCLGRCRCYHHRCLQAHAQLLARRCNVNGTLEP